jgi:hypothetical protein
MKIINVKRGWTTNKIAILNFEHDFLIKTHLRGIVIRNGKKSEAWNPFINVHFLKPMPLGLGYRK